MIEKGMSAELSKTISEYDIYQYAELTGDFNPSHINEVWAQKNIFGKRVAHGGLVAGLISAVIGTKCPGPGTIYMEQNLKFVKPVYIGDTITAKVAVTEIINHDKGIYRLSTDVFNQKEETVIQGCAVVKYVDNN